MELEKQFKGNGIVSIESFLNDTEKQIIRELIFTNFSQHIDIGRLQDFDVEDHTFHQKLIKLRKSHPAIFGEIYDKINLNARFRSLFSQHRFLKLFSEVLGTDINKIFLNGFMLRFDAPLDQRNSLGWHQDSPYYMMSAPEFNAGVCWMSVTTNSEENGTLVYVPGTHHTALPFSSTKTGNLSSEQLLVNVTDDELENIKNLDQNFGDLSLLHMNIKHKSGINTSSKVRITMGCRFHDMQNSFNVGKEIYHFNDKKFSN